MSLKVTAMDRPPEGIVRNAIFAGASKIAGAAFTAVLTIFLVRYLGQRF